jgi:uncharacterized protein DUF4231
MTQTVPARAPTDRPFDAVWLRNDLSALVDALDLRPDQLHFVRSRWLESLLWMEDAAQKTRRRYYALRLVTVVGAVIVPALVSINAVGKSTAVVTWLTFSISLVVAISAAVEGFFRFGERWRHYRAAVEELKALGWDFQQLTGIFNAAGATHASAFPAFADHVNEILKQETATYIAQIATPTAGDTAQAHHAQDGGPQH